GKSYRFVNVDADVTIDGATATLREGSAQGAAQGTAQDVAQDGAQDGARMPLPPAFFTVDGYAPFSAQMLLMRYWQQHGRPRVLRTIPGSADHRLNEVVIEARGRDTFHVGSASFALDRFSIDGVVWGRETVWLDGRGVMAAAITRAGGLSFEAVREDLEPALSDFVLRGTADRLRDLASITSAVPPIRAGAYALVGATVVDATGHPPIQDGVIVVRDGRIADVGPR